MADPTGVNFNGPVYAYTADMFSKIPIGGSNTDTFSLNSGETPGTITLNSPDTPIMTDGGGSTMTGSGTVTSSGGTSVTFDGSDTVQAEGAWDFVAPDGNTYWMIQLNEGGEFLYVSNYSFQSGETYNSLGGDGSPGISGNTYDSIFEPSHFRVDEIAAPDAPDQGSGGSTTYVAWNADDLTFAGSTVSINASAVSGTFTSFDNDDWIDDGTATYSATTNDISQIGSASVGGTNSFTDELYQAEAGFRVQTSSGDVFDVIKIQAETGDVVYVSTGKIQPGDTYTILVADGSPNYDNALPDADEIGVQYSTLVTCFTSGTLIKTQAGEIPVEDLSQGDLVLTLDNGYQPIRWIGAKHLSKSDLEEHRNLRPIRIRAGALGDCTPVQDLLVSPQHRVLVSSQIAQRMFRETEVLVGAKHLVLLEGIDVADDVTEVTYVHILFDRHEVVFSNGALTESLYTGPQALKSVSPEAKAEILDLFPELADVDYEALSCRKLANGRMGRKLAIWHKNNNKPLVQAELFDGVR